MRAVMMQWFADGLVAVLAGVVAEALYGVAGPPAVFRASAACLGTSFFMIALLWRENIMKAAPAPSNTPAQPAVASRSVFANVSDALAFAWDDPRVILLALIQSLFEAAMYSFVLVWVPTLSAAAAAEAAATGSAAPSTLPFGLIFACFMVCIMIGSGLFAFAQASNRVVLGLLVVMLGSAASLGCVGLLSTQPTIVALGFLLFETFCGLYFPRCVTALPMVNTNYIMTVLSFGIC